MKYIVRTNHTNATNYVCYTSDDIEKALEYAIKATQEGEYYFPLAVETDGHDEVCIVSCGRCYQYSTTRQIIDDERSGQ